MAKARQAKARQAKELAGDSAALAVSHQTLKVNGVRLHVVLGGLPAGAGPALYLLHGYPQSWYVWRKLAPLLAGHFRLVMPNLRGYGDSDKPLSGYDKRSMAQDIRELARALGDERLLLAGHDRGGRVAPAGNPPLYVSKVTYGRQVFFLVQSQYSATQIQAALTATYSGGVASGTITGGLTNDQVMQKTHINYVVIGGSAALALAPIAAATQSNDNNAPQAGQMFNAIQTFIGSAQGAGYTPSNPGVPISYTLSYLRNNSVAEVGYTAVYDKKDCSALVPGMVPHTYTLAIYNVDDSAQVQFKNWSNSNLDTMYTPGYGATINNGNPVDITTYIQQGGAYVNSSGVAELHINLYNGGCFSTGISFNLYGDNQQLYHRDYSSGGIRNCGEEAYYVFNLTTWSLNSAPANLYFGPTTIFEAAGGQ